LGAGENKPGPLWHCFVPGAFAPEAAHYAYRVEGPWDPGQGHRFDARRILFDPFAEAIVFPPDFSRQAAIRPEPNDGRAPLGVLPRRTPGRRPHAGPRHEAHETIVYELHVKGFTARPNSGVSPENRGTFLGLVEMIPYLRQ